LCPRRIPWSLNVQEHRGTHRRPACQR
jgi:hypothetical protein